MLTIITCSADQTEEIRLIQPLGQEIRAHLIAASTANGMRIENLCPLPFSSLVNSVDETKLVQRDGPLEHFADVILGRALSFTGHTPDSLLHISRGGH
jgi:hypothetical protein